MDSITQAALGASIGEAVAGRKLGNKAAAVGAMIGTIPDLDVLLLLFIDEVSKISFHRGISHSIFFCVIVSIFLAYLMGKSKWTKELSFSRSYFMTFFCLFTHVLLDSFTTYGTQLLLPFSDWRVSFDSINIIDPFYTVPLIIGLLLSLLVYHENHERRSIPNNIGLIIGAIYLLFTLANKQHVQREFYKQLYGQNIPSYGILTVPVKIGNVNWYGVAKGKENLHIGHYSITSQNKIQFESFPINDELLEAIDPKLISKLKWVSQGYYTVAQKDGNIRVYNMQCDMQGIRNYGDYKAPTAFYYELSRNKDNTIKLTTGMHQ